ncbi:predicted protein [Botrytis cinerea T4]|uniref:Uncharacterized protein n=1 Tax=Botryotinia fuckeliana (strain T4) TaxID=999810 RepID=G2YK47_BOTF4|nr:predicted protein [Botrytis cinerea T4]
MIDPVCGPKFPFLTVRSFMNQKRDSSSPKFETAIDRFLVLLAQKSTLCLAYGFHFLSRV